MITEKDRHVLEHWSFPLEEAARNSYRSLQSRLQKIYDDVLIDQSKPIRLDDFLEDFLKECEIFSWAFFRVFSDGQEFRRSPSSTAFNSAVVAYHFARENQWEPVKLKTFVRGTLLHEVGMLFVPSEIINKQGKVDEKERAIIEAHPSVTAELVQKWMELPEIQAMALGHHEDWNGAGYPKGLQGSQIHLFAQTLSVIQSFVAMATQRGYRNSMVGYLSMKQLLQLKGTRFSEELVLEFVNTFGLHPPGSVVLLSDGSISRVIEPVMGNPLRPKVRILIDSSGKEFRQDNGAQMELDQVKKIFIARPVNLLDLQISE